MLYGCLRLRLGWHWVLVGGDLSVFGTPYNPTVAQPLSPPATHGARSMTRPVWLPEGLFPFESRYITVGTHRVHYVDESSGPAILFVHGNPDYSLLYRHQIGALRAVYRCIALDLPGFGLSTPGDAFGFTPAEQVSTVEGFVQQLGLRDLVFGVRLMGTK